jgi:hypothetical protein
MPPPAKQTSNGPQQQPNATAFVFRKAVKQNAKLRLALSGSGGSGKTYTTYTLLKLAAALGGRIAALDTEHGSMEKYADQFEKPGDETAATLARWLAAPVPQKPQVSASTAVVTEGVLKHWATRGEMKRLFGEVREQVGELVYLEILERFSVKDPGEFRKSADAVQCYEMLTENARREVG